MWLALQKLTMQPIKSGHDPARRDYAYYKAVPIEFLPVCIVLKPFWMLLQRLHPYNTIG